MKLSIITINYNNAEGLRKTLASVAAQTYRDFEHIIVDGGSTDGSVDVIREYESSLASRLSPLASNLKWISEKDTGIYNAMNKGIEIALGKRIVNSFNRSELVEDKNKGIRMAQGEYLLFLNSGDCLVNELILNKVFANNFDEDIVYGNIYVVEQNGRKTLATAPNSEEITFVSIHYKKLFHPASFIKKDLMFTIGGYDETIKVTADFAFFVLAICKYNCSLKKIDIPISVFELGGISTLSSAEELSKEGLYMIEKYFPRHKTDYQKYYYYKNKLNSWPYNFIEKIKRKCLRLCFFRNN